MNGGAGGNHPLRWVYLQTNLATEAGLAAALEVVDRAGRAGFNGLVFADAKLMTLERYGMDRPAHPYARNVRRLREAASAAGLDVIPHVPVVAGAHGLFVYDPNLAEGFEVRDAVFEVRGGVAQLVQDPDAVLVNGGFERHAQDRFEGWAYQDDPGRATAVDTVQPRSGTSSLRLEPQEASRHGLCRIHQTVRVRPRRYYRVTAWVKTEGLKPVEGFKLSVAGMSPDGERPLVFQRFDIQPTQDFSEVHAVFNSLEFQEVRVYLGLWGGREGRAWVDDCELAEMGLVNVLRRPGCPLTVRSADGSIEYEERRDFARVHDPLLGRAGGVQGVFDRYHPPPGIRMLNGLPDGTRLKVGFYHPLMDKISKVDACMSEPKADEILERQVERIHRLFGEPDRYVLGYNEIRAAGSCRACKATGRTPGQILADHVRRTVAMMRRIRPDVKLAVWHDMFDPHANAVEQYYLVDGPLTGSWEGLPPDITVLNWSENDLAASLGFFAGRKLVQVISIDVDRFENPQTGVRDAIRAAADAGAEIQGVMYTTWSGRYGLLEPFGRTLSEVGAGR